MLIASAPYPPAGALLKSPLGTQPDSSRISPEDRIRQAQKGSLEAFNEVVLMHQDRIYRQALWLLNDPDAAEDACQEAFVHAYRKIHTFDGPSARNWLLRIVTNICLDELRAIKRHRNQPLENFDANGEEMESTIVDPREPLESAMERSEQEAEMLRAMQRLTPEYRMALTLVDLQELDYTEACAVLHIPIGTLKSRVARARVKLGEEMRDRQ